MKCSKIQKKLSAYQDRELTPQEHEEISRRLLSCRAFREQYAEFERIWRTLGEVEEIHPDPWFYRQVVRKIREPREQAFLPSLQHVFRPFRVPVAISIILIIGLLAGTYLGSILARCDLFPFQSSPVSYSPGVLTSVRVFDPAPPGTFAEGYFRMLSYKESDSR
jgi:anti-sigma factor RsiW